MSYTSGNCRLSSPKLKKFLRFQEGICKAEKQTKKLAQSNLLCFFNLYNSKAGNFSVKQVLLNKLLEHFTAKFDILNDIFVEKIEDSGKF